MSIAKTAQEIIRYLKKRGSSVKQTTLDIINGNYRPHDISPEMLEAIVNERTVHSWENCLYLICWFCYREDTQKKAIEIANSAVLPLWNISNRIILPLSYNRLLCPDIQKDIIVWIQQAKIKISFKKELLANLAENPASTEETLQYILDRFKLDELISWQKEIGDAIFLNSRATPSIKRQIVDLRYRNKGSKTFHYSTDVDQLESLRNHLPEKQNIDELDSILNPKTAQSKKLPKDEASQLAILDNPEGYHISQIYELAETTPFLSVQQKIVNKEVNDKQTLYFLATNKHLHEEIARQLTHSHSIELAYNPAMTPQFQESLLQEIQPKFSKDFIPLDIEGIFRGLCYNAKTESLLRKLWRIKEKFYDALELPDVPFSYNRILPADLIRQLAQTSNIDIIDNLMNNPNTPADIQKKLIEKEYRSREGHSAFYSDDIQALENLRNALTDSDKKPLQEINKHLSRTAQSYDVIIPEDDEAYQLKIAQSYENIDGILYRLASKTKFLSVQTVLASKVENNMSEIGFHLADNPHLYEEIAQRLIPLYTTALAGNEHLSETMQEKIFDEASKESYFTAINGLAITTKSQKLIRKLLEYSKNLTHNDLFSFYHCLAANEIIHTDIIEKIMRFSDEYDKQESFSSLGVIKQTLATNPATPPNLKKELLERHYKKSKEISYSPDIDQLEQLRQHVPNESDVLPEIDQIIKTAASFPRTEEEQLELLHRSTREIETFPSDLAQAVVDIAYSTPFLSVQQFIFKHIESLPIVFRTAHHFSRNQRLHPSIIETMLSALTKPTSLKEMHTACEYFSGVKCNQTLSCEQQKRLLYILKENEREYWAENSNCPEVLNYLLETAKFLIKTHSFRLILALAENDHPTPEFLDYIQSNDFLNTHDYDEENKIHIINLLTQKPETQSVAKKMLDRLQAGELFYHHNDIEELEKLRQTLPAGHDLNQEIDQHLNKTAQSKKLPEDEASQLAILDNPEGYHPSQIYELAETTPFLSVQQKIIHSISHINYVFQIKMCLAKNPHLCEEVALNICKDNNIAIIRKMALNADLPESVLIHIVDRIIPLAKTEKQEFSYLGPNRMTLPFFARHQKKETVLRRIFNYAFENGNNVVLINLAKNTNTSPQMLVDLLKTKDSYISIEVMNNPKCPDEIRKAIIDEFQPNTTAIYHSLEAEQLEALRQFLPDSKDIRHEIDGILEKTHQKTADQDYGFHHEETRRFWGQKASGCLFVRQHPEFGKQMLLIQRSMNVEQPGTWGIPGGALPIEEEDLLISAIRETKEEIGPIPPYKVIGNYVWNSPQKTFSFTTFILQIEDLNWTPQQFNWEVDDAQWVTAENAQHNPDLHFGVRDMLEDEQIPLKHPNVSPEMLKKIVDNSLKNKPELYHHTDVEELEQLRQTLPQNTKTMTELNTILSKDQ